MLICALPDDHAPIIDGHAFPDGLLQPQSCRCGRYDLRVTLTDRGRSKVQAQLWGDNTNVACLTESTACGVNL